MCNKNFKKGHAKGRAGFTLLEMLVAVGIFAIVATAAISTILVSVNANRKSTNTRGALDSIQFAIDDMTTNIRFGSDYDCSPPVPPALPAAGTCVGGTTVFGLRDATGAVVLYRLNVSGTLGTLQRSVGNVLDWKDLTDPSIDIQNVNFFARNDPAFSGAPNAQYPRVLIKITGIAGNVSKGTQKEFSVQTTVTKRNAITQ